MKRILMLFLVSALCLSMCGCGDRVRVRELEEKVAALESRLEELESREEVLQEVEPAVPDTGAINSMAAQLRSEISTFEDAVDYLDGLYPELWMSAHVTDGMSDRYWLESGESILNQDPFQSVAGRSCIVNAVTYLLSDDMEIYTVIGFWHDEGGGCPLKAINCIRTEEGFRFADPVANMRGDEMSAYGKQLPQAQAADFDDYTSLVLSDQELSSTLDSMYVFEGGGQIDFTQNMAGWVTLTCEPVAQLYINENNYISDEDYYDQTYGHVVPENIGLYQLSGELGGTTLTVEEAYALVGAEPETIKQKVRTAADLLMYMLAVRIGDNGGCYCDNWDGYTWHTNYTAKEVMERKLGNCGSCANLANYLLEDDYEEIGIILHAYYPGNGGGHVYNYVKYEGAYYILDYSWYIFANYDPASDFPVMHLTDLASYGARVEELYGGVSLVIAHTSTGRHLPNIFGEEFGDNHYYVPEGAEYTVLYESADGYRIGEMPFDKQHYDWDVFW